MIRFYPNRSPKILTYGSSVALCDPCASRHGFAPEEGEDAHSFNGVDCDGCGAAPEDEEAAA